MEMQKRILHRSHILLPFTGARLSAIFYTIPTTASCDLIQVMIFELFIFGKVDHFLLFWFLLFFRHILLL